MIPKENHFIFREWIKGILVDIVVSVLIGFLACIPDFTLSTWLWWTSILFVSFAILITFFSLEEDQMNVTINWSKRAKKAKDVIGNILTSILLILGVLFIVALISIM